MANQKKPGANYGVDPNKVETLDDELLDELDLEDAEPAPFEDESTAIFQQETHGVMGSAAGGADDDFPDGEFEDEATRVWQQPKRSAPRPTPAPTPASRPVSPSRPMTAPTPQLVTPPDAFDDSPMADEATMITDSAALYRGAAPRQQLARSQSVPAVVAPPPSERRSPVGLILLVGALLAALLAIYFLLNRQGPAEPVAAGPSATAAAADGILAVYTTPAGADVLLDGQRVGNRTPTVLTELETGRPYTLKVEMDGYGDVEDIVIIRSDQPMERRFELVSTRVTLEINSFPAGAAVSVDGVSRGQTPLTITNVERGKSYQVVATLAGHETETRSVEIPADGDARESVSLRFTESVPGVAVEEPAAPVASSGSGAARSSGSTVRVRQEPVAAAEPADRGTRPSARPSEAAEPAVRVRPSAAEEPAAAAEPAGFGTLSVQAVPFGQVLINGRPVADETPLLNHRLPVGTYQVKVYFLSLRRFSETRTVQITANGRRTLSFRASE